MSSDIWSYIWSNIWSASAGIGTIMLAIGTYLSLKKLDDQMSYIRSQAKIAQLNEEMTKLVAPLKLRKEGIDKRYYFDLNYSIDAPGLRNREHEMNSHYYGYWDNIKINMYLGPDYLWNSLYNYLKAKEKYYTSKAEYTWGYGKYSGMQFDKTKQCEEIVENFEYEYEILKAQIERRYFEIKDEIEEYQKSFS